jgi:uncharacterized membrane protein
VPLLQDVPDGAIEIQHDSVGYLQHLDVKALSTIAEKGDLDIYVRRRPGGHCDPSTPIASVVLHDASATYDAALTAGIRAAFTLGERRSYDQDPRFGLIALSEIGSRALSPGINDPGTAIDVLATLVRVLVPDGKEERDREDRDISYPHVHLPQLREDDLIDAAFMPISRDGAGLVEVSIRLQEGAGGSCRGRASGDAACRATARGDRAEDDRWRSWNSNPIGSVLWRRPPLSATPTDESALHNPRTQISACCYSTNLSRP